MMTNKFIARIRQGVAGAILRAGYPLLYAVSYIWRRLLFQTRFVVVTGSVGKTTCKEGLALALSERFRVYRTYRNQNGRQLICLNVLRVRPWHQFAVIEAGTDTFGKLARVSRLLRPDLAIIVDVAETHSRGYSSLEETAREKLSLFKHMKPGSVTIINGDNPYLADHEPAPGIQLRRFGSEATHDLRIRGRQSDWPGRFRVELEMDGSEFSVQTQLVGTHWAGPVSAVVLAAYEMGVPVQESARALAKLVPFTARLEPVEVPSGAVILRDEYNASYVTYRAAFEVMRQATAERRIGVFADCTDSLDRPRKRVAQLVGDAASWLDLLVWIEPHGKPARLAALASGMRDEQIVIAEDWSDALRILKDILSPGDLVLLKGQTHYHLSRLIFALAGPVGCSLPTCKIMFACDTCWRLGVSEETRKRVVYAKPGAPEAAHAGQAGATTFGFGS